MRELKLKVQSQAGTRRETLGVQRFVIAGWTGRDRNAVEHHIAELEALGVARPASVPIFYRVAAARLTTAAELEVVGDDSSGEVEFVLVAGGGKTYVGVGSDHTDRKVETYGVTVSKQMCDKPIGETFWPFDEVADHWDQLILRSYAESDGKRVLYQEGTVANMLPPQELIQGFCQESRLPDGVAMFCGTLAAIGGVHGAEYFEGELEDPVLKRKIGFRYAARTLPVLG